jgi:uncharacterized membrane protein
MVQSRLTSLRNAFLSGLLTLAPLGITIWVVGWILDLVGGPFRRLFEPYLPAPLQSLGFLWNILATVAVVLVVTALGYVSRYVFGQYFGGLAERLVQSIPGVGSVYNTVKQFIDTFGPQEHKQFSKVVIVPFPRAGAHTIGFVTNTGRGEPHRHLPGDHWAVFVPTCPSPVNGFFMFLPVADVVELDMSVSEGMKVVISCGAVLPSWPDPATARAALQGGGGQGT